MLFFFTKKLSRKSWSKNSGLADGSLRKKLPKKVFEKNSLNIALSKKKPLQKELFNKDLKKKQKLEQVSPSVKPEIKPADGTIHVTLTKNNTMLTLTDPKGDVVTWTSCQNCGFYGGQKTTQIATVTTAEEMGFRAIDFEMKKVNVIFRGKPRLRQAVLRGLSRSRVQVQQFILDPAIPYNGCRLQKKSRK